MIRAQLEAEPALRALRHRLEEILGRLDGRAADLADEMAVCLGGEVIGGRAVPEVGVDHHAEALELLEVPVDGGGVHIRRERPGPRRAAPRRSGGGARTRAVSTRRRAVVTLEPPSRSWATSSSTVFVAMSSG